MYYLKRISILFFALLISCSKGGALTPVQSFNAVRSAVEKRDTGLISDNLSTASRAKFDRFRSLIKNMRDEQVRVISSETGLQEDRVRNLRDADCVSVYFFSESAGVKLGKYFNERIVSVDIDGGKAVVRVESGVELDFTREGPYWKFDISRL